MGLAAALSRFNGYQMGIVHTIQVYLAHVNSVNEPPVDEGTCLFRRDDCFRIELLLSWQVTVCLFLTCRKNDTPLSGLYCRKEYLT
jgi:hypothetical protein